MERYSVPSPVVFGAGAAARLGAIAVECGMRRPFVVSDRGLETSGLLARAQAALEHRSLRYSPREQTFCGVSSNPREDDVLAALELFSTVGADGIIAFGGGSVIDAAKGLRLLSAHSGTLTDYDMLDGGMERIVMDLPPLVAVPTTAGTGSEVSRGALIITRRGVVKRKTLVASPRLVPTVAVLDAELTVGLPPLLTAGTGMDALSHGIEEHLAPRFHPVVEALALSCVERATQALPAAIKDPGDIEARGEMLVAAMMGGIGFEKGLGVGHSFSHAIGALHDLHHGLLNAVLLPHALEFNREHCAGRTWRKLAAALGVAATGDDHGFGNIVGRIRELNDELGMPPRLRELGDLEADREEILARAFDDHCHRTNPRPCGPDDMLELWQRAW